MDINFQTLGNFKSPHVYGGARYEISRIFVRAIDARAHVFYAT